MIKFFLILTAVLFVGILLLFFLWRSEKTKRKETQVKLESTNKELARAIAEQARLESTIQILRKNRKLMKKSIICMTAMLLAMLLTGCTSTKIEYIEKPYLPELNFPFFPELYGDVRNPDDTVTVPGEWIIQLREFQIHYEETENDYNDLKALYEGNSEEKAK